MVPQNLHREKLIELARELHKRDPASSFRFFDDASQYEQFKLWDQHYPDPRYPSPESWVRRHYVAMLNTMLSSAGPRWELVAMEGGIHLIPDARSTTIAVID